MAVDQREALIAAVRAQVEKERAEKQKKLEREQEAMAFAKKKSGDKKDEGQKKYKTLSPEELARIEEKKRKKRAEELGIPYEPSDEIKAQEAKKNEDELKAKIEGLGGKSDGKGGLGDIPSGGGLGSAGLGGGLGADIGDGNVTVMDGSDDDKYSFGKDGTATVSEDSGWVSGDKSDDLDSIIPTMSSDNDIDSLFDMDDDDSPFAAQASNIEGFQDASSTSDIELEDASESAEAKVEEEAKEEKKRKKKSTSSIDEI